MMSSRTLPLPPVEQFEPDNEIYEEHTPAPEDDNDDFFSGAANQDNALHPPGSYNPAMGDYRTAGSIATQSVRAPSPPAGPILDHSHLRPGKQAALLSHERTLELYRANAKKTQDPDLQFEFAVFMIDASKTMPIPAQTPGNVIEVEKAIEKREDLIREAMGLLKRIADRGHPQSQYFLADCYANGIGTVKNKQDFDRAYPLFVLAAKHNHPDAAYRAGVCCENGWGCRRESAKALQFFRKAAAALHPGAMYRLGIAELNGELGLSKSPKEGVKWLKRSAENATAEFPHALYELALLHERGVDNVLFVDHEYSTELLAQAAELGYAPSAHRLGECYEYGKMGCPQDPALSIHYYVSFCYLNGLLFLLHLEHCRTTRSPGRVFCSYSMVPRRLARRSTPVGYGSLFVGQAGS
jgi:TPR repeat protein